MDQENKRKTIQDLGEFGLIDYLTNDFKNQNASTIFSVGDDCAVLERDNQSFTLVSKDLFIENVHFDLIYVPLKQLGYKVVSAAVSDIYAMNGFAEQIIVGIGLSNRFPLEALEELYEGIYEGCREYKIDLIGGDTSSSAKGLFLSVTAIGQVLKSKITYRHGGRASDIIMVSGDLGRPYLGLQILEREKSVYLSNPSIQPELEQFEVLVKKQLMPKSRRDIIELFDQLNVIPSSMIDISDGLASEIFHLCSKSNLGCVIFEEKLPFHEETLLKASEFNLSPLTCAMNGGEEYELLFSIKQEEYSRIQGNPNFTPIGYFQEPNFGIMLQDTAGTQHGIQAQGWRHF
jgi:thiamine-monophosphate kinase